MGREEEERIDLTSLWLAYGFGARVLSFACNKCLSLDHAHTTRGGNL